MEEVFMSGSGGYEICENRPSKKEVFEAFENEKPLKLILRQSSHGKMCFLVELIIDILHLYRRIGQDELKGYWRIEGHMITCYRLVGTTREIIPPNLLNPQKYIRFSGGGSSGDGYHKFFRGFTTLEGVEIQIFEKHEKRIKNKKRKEV